MFSLRFAVPVGSRHVRNQKTIFCGPSVAPSLPDSLPRRRRQPGTVKGQLVVIHAAAGSRAVAGAAGQPGQY